MLFARRLTALRATALVAILASAVLVADHVRPGREFCPLEEACSAAAQSELGSFLGVPTSVWGLGAFIGVLLVTLLPVRLARRILVPGCFVGALGAMGLIAYQAMELGSLCPLCMVADGAAILLGYFTLTWPPLPILRTGRRLGNETAGARTAWALAAALAIVSPFAVPKEEDAGWEEAPALTADLFQDEAPAQEATDASPTAVPTLVPAAPTSMASAASLHVPPAVESTTTDAGTEADTEAPTQPEQAPQPEAPDVTPEPVAPTVTPTRAVKVSPAISTLGMATPFRAMQGTPVPPTHAAAKTPTVKPTPAASIQLVEYLNAFCAHCRATHARLDRIIEHDGVRVKRRRVYTWKGSGYPMWARACAYAASLGREDAMFRELTRARRESQGEVFAAAQRAGIDSPAFRQALKEREPPPRLVRDKRIAQNARLKRLPTFDIGRRRLSGSQSERELRTALRAARARLTPTDG